MLSVGVVCSRWQPASRTTILLRIPQRVHYARFMPFKQPRSLKIVAEEVLVLPTTLRFVIDNDMYVLFTCKNNRVSPVHAIVKTLFLQVVCVSATSWWVLGGNPSSWPSRSMPFNRLISLCQRPCSSTPDVGSLGSFTNFVGVLREIFRIVLNVSKILTCEIRYVLHRAPCIPTLHCTLMYTTHRVYAWAWVSMLKISAACTHLAINHLSLTALFVAFHFDFFDCTCSESCELLQYLFGGVGFF